jgi:putative nucleotidyltransferase with HDIG domain
MLLSRKDAYTAEHSEEVAKYALIIADKLGLSRKSKRVLNKAGYLHDIGKIGISESILNKAGRLTTDEYEEIKKHSTIGYEIVSQFPNLNEVAIIVKYHHELLDGSGYPEGLKGGDIPLSAQILGVADVFSALTTDRPYREGFNYWKAFEIMAEMPLNQEMVAILKDQFTIH